MAESPDFPDFLRASFSVYLGTDQMSKRRALVDFVFPKGSFAYFRVPENCDAASPFPSDSAFLEAKDIAVFLAHVIEESPAALRDTKLLDAEGLTLIDAMLLAQRASSAVTALVAARLQAMPLAPRVHRYARVLRMDDAEVEALTVLTVVNTGRYSAIVARCTPQSVARCARMQPDQVLRFVHEARDHMRQGVVELTKSKGIPLAESRLTVPLEILPVFSGTDLSDEELIKLNKVGLDKVLLEERHWQRQREEEAAKEKEAALAARDALAETAVPSAEGSPFAIVSPVSPQHPSGGGGVSASFATTSPPQGPRSSSSDAHDAELTTPPQRPQKPLGSEAAGESTTSTALAPPSFAGASFAAVGMSFAGKSFAAGLSFAASPSSGTGKTHPPIPLTPTRTEKKTAEGFDEAQLLSKMDKPYTDDIEYCEEHFQLLATLIKIEFAESDLLDDDGASDDVKLRARGKLRTLAGRERLLRSLIASRMAAAEKAGPWLPRVEVMARRLGMTPFEKDVLLLMVGNVVSHDVLIAINGRDTLRGGGARNINVGFVLLVLTRNLANCMDARKAFSKSGVLISTGLVACQIMISGRSKWNTDLMDYTLDVDRKVVDFVVGLDTATSDMVSGSSLYDPVVDITKVVLPEATKSQVMSALEHFEMLKECRRACGFFGDSQTQQQQQRPEDVSFGGHGGVLPGRALEESGVGGGVLPPGRSSGSSSMGGGGGLVLLFHGPSGTGKTMFANGIAHFLKKKVLLVVLAHLKGEAKAIDILRYVFREARLNDAVVFFDECESFFESREYNPLVTSILDEFERYDGVVIMATNRAEIIDEAMNRRISLMLAFKPPDHSMRLNIWKAHLPNSIRRGPDVDLQEVAMNFELTGGLIKNAALAALSKAVARDNSDDPVVTQADLVAGARQQLRGFFQASDARSVLADGAGGGQYVTPKRQLADVIADRTTKAALEEIAKATKARHTLFTQWGFDEAEQQCNQGALHLFFGPSGTGKSLAAEAIALECGCSLRITNVSEMTRKKDGTIEDVFEEGRKLGSILVFDAAEPLFDYTDTAFRDCGLIQYHAARYPRPVIVVVTTEPGRFSYDSMQSRLAFVSRVQFQLPGTALREEMWRKALPEKTPVSGDVDFKALAEKEATAKIIRQACFSACGKAALRLAEQRLVTHASLVAELNDQLKREEARQLRSSFFL